MLGNSAGSLAARWLFRSLYYGLPNLSNYSVITAAAHGYVPEARVMAVSVALRDLLLRRAIGWSDVGFQPAEFQMKKDALRFLVIVLGAGRGRPVGTLDGRSSADMNARFSEERLYVDGATAKRLTFAFNGIAPIGTGCARCNTSEARLSATKTRTKAGSTWAIFRRSI